jgi:hypothetical protein
VHDGRASHAAEASLGRVETSARDGEATGNEALAAFQRVVDATAEGTAVDGALEGAVTTLQRVCETAARGVRATITSARRSCARSPACGRPRRSTACATDARRAAIVARAQIAIRGVGERPADLDQGEKAYAGPLPRREGAAAAVGAASFDDPGRASRARKNLDAVEATSPASRGPRRVRRRARGRPHEGLAAGCRMLATFLDPTSPRLLLPVPVTTEPAPRASASAPRARPPRPRPTCGTRPSASSR